MEQITAMKITALSFCAFRSHTEPEGYAFGDITYITGDNGAGKTTMAHGVAYALYGVSFFRSEERRVGKECRSRWSPYH